MANSENREPKTEEMEKLIMEAAEIQKLAKPQDKLTALVDRYSDFFSEELTEDELRFAAAASVPDTPKYKSFKNK